MSDQVKKGNQEEIVINLNSFGVPIAIIVAGVLIAGGIWFAGRNRTVNDTSNATGDTTTSTEETDTTEDGVLGTYSQYITSGKSTTVDDDPYVGNMDTAKVAIVEFSDYQCSYCGRHTTQVLPDILENLVNTGNVVYVFRDYQMFGDLSENTAKVGECIADISMDKFLEFHEEAYSQASLDDVYDIASDLGLDIDELMSCVVSYDDAELTNDLSAGENAGVSGTPAFVIGTLSEDGTVTGRLVSGALPYEAFEAVVNEYLQ